MQRNRQKIMRVMSRPSSENYREISASCRYYDEGKITPQEFFRTFTDISKDADEKYKERLQKVDANSHHIPLAINFPFTYPAMSDRIVKIICEGAIREADFFPYIHNIDVSTLVDKILFPPVGISAMDLLYRYKLYLRLYHGNKILFLGRREDGNQLNVEFRDSQSRARDVKSLLYLYISMSNHNPNTFNYLRREMKEKLPLLRGNELPEGMWLSFPRVDGVVNEKTFPNYKAYLQLLSFFHDDFLYPIIKGIKKYSPQSKQEIFLLLLLKEGRVYKLSTEREEGILSLLDKYSAKLSDALPERVITEKEKDKLDDYLGSAIFLNCPLATFSAFKLWKKYTAPNTPNLCSNISRMELQIMPDDSGCAVLCLLDDKTIKKLTEEKSVTLQKRLDLFEKKHFSLITEPSVEINNKVIRAIYDRKLAEITKIVTGQYDHGINSIIASYL